MKTKTFTFATIAVAAMSLFTTSCSKSNDQANTEDTSEIVLNNIMTRTSIRAFEQREVEEEKIEKILKAGMAAPTAVNKQPWAFVVVRDKEVLKQLSEGASRSSMVAEAAFAVIPCCDLTKTLDNDGKEFWIQDLSALSENTLLAAHALGLGAVWTGVYPIEDRVNHIREVLKLPEYIVPFCLIPMGYPAENPTPKDKWKPEQVYENQWGTNYVFEK